MIVLIFPYQTPFLLPHVFYFPPNLHFPQLITGICLLWLGQDRGREARGPHGHRSLFLGSSSERGVMRILTVIILVPFTLCGAQASRVAKASIICTSAIMQLHSPTTSA